MGTFDVSQYGTDAYGRPVFMTEFMHLWFETYVSELGWRPRILQGAYMERLGGGAQASQGAHDKGKCLDLETEGQDTAGIDHMVRTARVNAAGAYRRDRTWAHGGMTPHMHLTLGADAPGSPMAEILWESYKAGGDGLGIQPPQPDYEWRPEPLVLIPPEVDMRYRDWDPEDKKALADDLAAAILDQAKVDAEKKISVRQAINQIRNAVKR